jgi:hypothetical protein
MKLQKRHGVHSPSVLDAPIQRFFELHDHADCSTGVIDEIVPWNELRERLYEEKGVGGRGQVCGIDEIQVVPDVVIP